MAIFCFRQEEQNCDGPTNGHSRALFPACVCMRNVSHSLDYIAGLPFDSVGKLYEQTKILLHLYTWG